MIQHNFDLTSLNTFGVGSTAEYFAEVSDTVTLSEISNRFKNLPVFVLGGGSNILLTKDVNGLVIKNNFRGIEVVREDESYVYLKVGAGENWHHVVLYCVEKGWGGVENLSLIPGLAGAAPIQNIGAYGVEIKDVLCSVEAFHLRDGTTRNFSENDCRLTYRDSIFKHDLKGRYCILSILIRLSKKPSLNVSYGSITAWLEQMKISSPTVKDVSNAVIKIRQSKLPDPKELGNAGSFFKNPVIGVSQFEQLQSRYPRIHHYPAGEKIKIPAAWLIENCGLKGYREGNVGCYAKQPLVIVNYGGATGEEILKFSEKIIETVYSHFGIRLEREVNTY